MDDVFIQDTTTDTMLQTLTHYHTILENENLKTAPDKSFFFLESHRSNIVPYYPKELFIQEQMEKYSSDNSLLKFHPMKPPLTKSKTVSFSLDNLEVPSTNDLPPQLTGSLSEIPEHTSENYTTRNSRLRRQPIKDYRVFIPQSKISASRTAHT